MANFTGAVPLSMAQWANLFTKMKAAGYKGSGIVSSLGIHNADPAAAVVLVISDDATNPPGVPFGWQIGAGDAHAGKTFFSDRGANNASLDLSTTWLFSMGPTSVNVIAIGA